MQKNVNIFLLMLVLLVAGALAGSAVYYQHKFGELTGKQESTSVNLTECRSDLDNYKFNLNKTLRSLTTSTQDVKRYDELYATKDDELKSTKDVLVGAETDLKQAKITIHEETALKNKYKKDYDDQLDVNQDLDEQNAILTSQKAQLESSVITYRSRLDLSEECISDFITSYSGTLIGTMEGTMEDEIDDCKP
ncbi:hypothetical protein HQ545_02425 [Candidatus Woesearchaeota archaeon]|nr:hypothetical protein [Candidatus Woesearchaeota archaeon]